MKTIAPETEAEAEELEFKPLTAQEAQVWRRSNPPISVVKIVVGQALDSEGEIGPAARHALRVAEEIRGQTDLPVELWDESFSTQIARETRVAMGVRRSKRTGHLDDLAAVIVLQSYLDAHWMGGEEQANGA